MFTEFLILIPIGLDPEWYIATMHEECMGDIK